MQSSWLPRWHGIAPKHCLWYSQHSPCWPGSQLCYFWSCADANKGCNHADWNPTFELCPYSIKYVKTNMPLLDSWSYIWFLCKIILRGIALNTAKTAFLKQSSIQKTNFPKAINYQEKKKIYDHLSTFSNLSITPGYRLLLRSPVSLGSRCHRNTLHSSVPIAAEGSNSMG